MLSVDVVVSGPLKTSLMTRLKAREQVSDGQVLLGLSGGVDSSVEAALLHRSIGDQLVHVFVDNGLLRSTKGSGNGNTCPEPSTRYSSQR